MSRPRHLHLLTHLALLACLVAPAAAQLEVIEDCNLNGIEDVFDAVNCPGDLDGDGLVTFADLDIVLTNWSTPGGFCAGDLDSSAYVDFEDMNIVLQHWGDDCNGPMTRIAAALSTEMAFEVEAASLGVTTIDLFELPAPEDVTDEELRWSGRAAVPVMLEVECTLSEVDGSNPVSRMARIDLLSGVLFDDGGLIHTVGDLFPGARGGGLVRLALRLGAGGGAAFGARLAGPGVKAVAARPEYHTDKGPKFANRVISFANGGKGPTAFITEFNYLRNLKNIAGNPRFTNAQVLDLIGERTGGDGTAGGAATDAYDCHGLTFAAGLVWINDNQVAKILADNGYGRVGGGAGAVKVGDVAIFRRANTTINHSETVITVAGGAATELRGKWGALGQYDHAIGVEVYTNTVGGAAAVQYYSTARAGGNLLKKGVLRP